MKKKFISYWITLIPGDSTSVEVHKEMLTDLQNGWVIERSEVVPGIPHRVSWFRTVTRTYVHYILSKPVE